MSANRNYNGYALYNGIRLPALPETYKDTHPYMLVQRSAYVLCVDVGDFVVKNSASLYTTSAADVKRFTLQNGVWVHTDDFSWGANIGITAANSINWANYDILNTDGTVYLAASDVVLLYDCEISYYSISGEIPASKTVEGNDVDGYVLTEADLPTLSFDGYVFKGWSVNDKLVSVGDKIEGDVALLAVWEELITYDETSFQIGLIMGLLSGDANVTPSDTFDVDSFNKGYETGLALRK